MCSTIGTFLCLVVPARERKMLKTVVFSVVIAVTLLPLADSKDLQFDFYMPDLSSSGVFENSVLHTQNLLEKEIYKKVSDFLINRNITEYEIYVSTYFDEDENAVVLEQIKVELGTRFKNKCAEIKSELSADLGETVNVEVKRNG